MLCPKCGKKMKNVKHFEDGRNYQYYSCECTFTTHQKRIHFDEFEKKNETNQNYKKK